MANSAKIFLIVLATLAAIVVGVVVWPLLPILFSDDRAIVILKNETDILVTSASVAFHGTKLPPQSIPPGSTREFSFKIDGEGSYHIHVEFDGGRSLDGDFGYLTSGMKHSKDHVAIRDNMLESTP